MRWISLLQKKPEKSGVYFWKGKGGKTGTAYFDENIGEFDFLEDVLAETVNYRYFKWLDDDDEFEMLCAFFKFFRDNGESHIGLTIEQFVRLFQEKYKE